MQRRGAAVLWHLLTAVVATVAVALQLVLVWQGHAVLDETNPPDLSTRLIRFIGYFTIDSNLLVALTAWALALGSDLESTLWRVLRLNAVVGIAVTGVVHWFLLRPLLDLSGADLLADRLLHIAVPVLAVVGWLLFGPRGRAHRGDVLPALVFPVAWLSYTLVRGEATGWYPYPFIDVGEQGYGVVAANSLGVAALILALTAGAVRLDGVLRASRQGRSAATDA